MRSLFLRVFLWFWLAMTAVIGAFVLVVLGTSRRPPPKPESLVADLLDTVGLAALDMLPQGGPRRVRRFLARIPSQQARRQYSIFSSEYPELSAERAPDPVRHLVEDAARDERLHRRRIGDRLLYAKCVGSGKGAVVVVFEAPAFEPLFAAATDPYALWLRGLAVVLVAGLVCYWPSPPGQRPRRRPDRRYLPARRERQGAITRRLGPVVPMRQHAAHLRPASTRTRPGWLRGKRVACGYRALCNQRPSRCAPPASPLPNVHAVDH